MSYRRAGFSRRAVSALTLGALALMSCGPMGSKEQGTEQLGEEQQALGSFTRQMKIDFVDLMRLGRVKPTINTPFNLGALGDIFDGDVETLVATKLVNPLVMTMAFDSAMSFRKTSMYIATEGMLKLEIANTLADLDSHTGSYVLAVNNQPLAQNTWASFNFNTSGKFVRATVTRVNGDDNVHVNEWELEASVTVNDIRVSPSSSVNGNAVKLLTGKSIQLNARYADASKYTYPITDGQTWSSSNTGVANVVNGRVTAGGTPGNATITVGANGVSQTIALTTLNNFTQIKDAGRTRKVAVVIRDPLVPQHGNKPLHEVYGWNDPDDLVPAIVSKFEQSSANTINYEVVETHTIDAADLHTIWEGAPLDFNQLIGFYDLGLPFWRNQLNAHADAGTISFEYNDLLTELQFCEKRNAGLIDEVWVYTDPYGGMYESRITDPEGFPYNSPPLLGTTCNRQLPIMGLNYEVGAANAVHSFGHRLENVGIHLMGRWDKFAQNPNDWEEFAAIDLEKPGKAGVGNTHWPMNSMEEGKYDKTNSVTSSEQTWQYYPFLMDIANATNCSAWGCLEDQYYQFMFGHVPRFAGVSDLMLNNWWHYFVDFLEASQKARDTVAGVVGNTTMGFENTSGWTASVGTKSQDTTDGERTQGAASLKMTGIGSGVTLTSGNLSSSSVKVSNYLSVDVRVPTQLAGQSGAQVKLCVKSPQRGVPNFVCGSQNSLNGIGLSAAPTFYTVPWTLPTATLNALKGGSFTDLQIQLQLSGVPAPAQSATWIFDRGVFFGP